MLGNTERLNHVLDSIAEKKDKASNFCLISYADINKDTLYSSQRSYDDKFSVFMLDSTLPYEISDRLMDKKVQIIYPYISDNNNHQPVDSSALLHLNKSLREKNVHPLSIALLHAEDKDRYHSVAGHADAVIEIISNKENAPIYVTSVLNDTLNSSLNLTCTDILKMLCSAKRGCFKTFAKDNYSASLFCHKNLGILKEIKSFINEIKALDVYIILHVSNDFNSMEFKLAGVQSINSLKCDNIILDCIADSMSEKIESIDVICTVMP